MSGTTAGGRPRRGARFEVGGSSGPRLSFPRGRVSPREQARPDHLAGAPGTARPAGGAGLVLDEKCDLGPTPGRTVVLVGNLGLLRRLGCPEGGGRADFLVAGGGFPSTSAILRVSRDGVAVDHVMHRGVQRWTSPSRAGGGSRPSRRFRARQHGPGSASAPPSDDGRGFDWGCRASAGRSLVTTPKAQHNKGVANGQD